MSAEALTSEKVSISGRGKTTLPVQARRHLEVEDGDNVVFQITSDGEVVVRTPENAE